MLKHKKVLLGFMLSILLIGCSGVNNSSKKSSFASSSSKTPIVSSESSSSQIPVVSTTSSTSNEIQTSSVVSTSKTKPTRPHTHKFGDWEIIIKADLFNTGEKYHKCEGCELSETVKYYDLSEVFFRDKQYQYSGQERILTIDGLLPKGISVRYTNNKLTNIGSVVSTAYFLNEKQEVVEERTAVLSITEKTGFPNININTANGAQINSKDKYTVAAFSIDNCAEEYKLDAVPGGIRWRGNGTLGAPKKAFRIKFDQKQKMLGLNDDAKCKSWVLMAEYYDYSFQRNGLAWSLGDALMNGRGYYSSDFTFANVYINGVYNGVYVVAEQQQVNKNRINIYEPEENETNVKIGYLLEMDSYAEQQELINVGNGSYEAYDVNGKKDFLPVRKYSIKSDFYSAEQKTFISKYMNNVYDIAYNAVVKGKYFTLDENYDIVNSNYTTTFDTLNAVIDVDSLVRSYILEEFMKDIDVGFSSYYMFVDFSENSQFKRLTFGAPWDFDWSSGNVTGGREFNTSGDYNTEFSGHMNPWLFFVVNTDFFYKMAHDYWTIMEECNVLGKIIDQMNYITDTFADEFDKNFQKWDVLGKGTHGYHSSPVWTTYTHRGYVDNLIQWCNGRKAYLDSKWL